MLVPLQRVAESHEERCLGELGCRMFGTTGSVFGSVVNR